jgi:integrase/recombinase XerC
VLLTEIKEYINQKKIQLEAPDKDHLFVNERGKKLYPKYVYRLTQKYLQKVTTIGKKSPHVLRHSFATHLSNNGAELNAVKELLGHASLAATQVYTHNTIEKLKNVHRKAHPKG